jgi:hypothetical protein
VHGSGSTTSPTSISIEKRNEEPQYITRPPTVLDKRLALDLRHPVLVRGIHQAVDIGRAGPADGEFLPHDGPPQGDLVHLSAFVRVPPAADEAGLQSVLVVVADAPHEVGAGFDAGEPAELGADEMRTVKQLGVES